MNSKDNVNKFISLYFDWFKKVGSNTARISGEVIKLRWVPDSSSKSLNNS